MEAHKWIKSRQSYQIPTSAVFVGNDLNGDRMYVGRTNVIGHLLPAKVVPAKETCFITWEEREYSINTFEILTGDHYIWIDCDHYKRIPPCAVRVGHTDKGKPLFCGRGYIHDVLTPGTITIENDGLVVPFAYHAHTISKYEILIQPFVWIQSTGTNIVPEAVDAGIDELGEYIYVGRAYHGDELIPAKIVPSKSSAYISVNGKQISKHEFEFLAGRGYCWVPSTLGNVPSNAVVCGQNRKGYNLYMGRYHYRDTIIPGKIEHGIFSATFPFKDKIELQYYEVLCRNLMEYGPTDEEFARINCKFCKNISS